MDDDDFNYGDLIDPDKAFLLITAEDDDALKIMTNLPDEYVAFLLEDALTSLNMKAELAEKDAIAETNAVLKKIAKDLH